MKWLDELPQGYFVAMLIGLAFALSYTMMGGLDTTSLLEQREKEMQFIMTSHNRINHENIQLKERVSELQTANEALMKYATPDSCIKAIKHTQLPKLKETK